MKRLKPQSRSVVLPIDWPISHGVRKNGEHTILTNSRGNTFLSACLGCPDIPCMTFTAAEINKEVRVASVALPLGQVCPVNALSQGRFSAVELDDDKCIGCGLCVERCPVGAINLDISRTKAVINHPNDYYGQVETDEIEFIRCRQEIANAIQTIQFLLPVFHLEQLVRKVSAILDSADGQRIVQVLVRNLFLLRGHASRLRNLGDNNNWCELAIDDGKYLLAGEIELSTDGLDALRRLLSDCAIGISRFGLDASDLVPIVVVRRLPNVRVDFYNVIRDARERLGIKIRTVPISLLLWSAHASDIDLLEAISTNCYIDDKNRSLLALGRSIGMELDQETAVAIGLIPEK